MKILISAYACEPDVGSESDVGWSWVKTFFNTRDEVYVITRLSNKPRIKNYLKKVKNTKIHFLYFDFPEFLIRVIRGFSSKQNNYFYFFIWQIGIFIKYFKFIKNKKFDYIHHVTFVSYRFASFLWFFESKFILGPVAGGEEINRQLRHNFNFKSKIIEKIRDLSNIYLRYSLLNKAMLNNSEKILLTSNDSLKFIPKIYHNKCFICPAVFNDKIGYKIKKKKTMQIYFAGRLIDIKGIKILLQIFKNLNYYYHNNFTLNIYGEGPLKDNIIDFAINNNFQKKIKLYGHLKKKDLIKQIKKNDLLIFPTLRDSGGIVILEALNNNINIITTNTSGPMSLIVGSKENLVDVKFSSYEKIIKSFTKKIIHFYESKKNLHTYKLNPLLLQKNKKNFIYN